MADIFEAQPRIAGAIDRRHGDGVHAHTDLDAVGNQRLVTHVHAAHRMGTAMIHAAVIHPAMVCCHRVCPGRHRAMAHGTMVHSRH